jgi:hypothetical protein
MFIRVMFHCFFGVPNGMHRVPVSHVRMVAGLDVIAFFVVASGFAMMFGRVVMMCGGLEMMFSAFVLGHVVCSSLPMLRAVQYGAVRSG